MQTTRCDSTIAWAVVFAAAIGMGGWCAGQDDEPGDVSAERIARLVAELGDPSYERRTEATRALCALGAPAIEALERAAGENGGEVALRARGLLRVIGQLMFGGVEVRLSVSKLRIEWDEPVDVTITMTNRSRSPARVPFETDSVAREKLSGDGRQVAYMLDLAEHLRVTDADGDPITLTVDDISADQAVEAVVERRAESGPVTTLQPGQSASITARAFNRGWARYRLLDAGAFAIVLDYVPAWDDEVLAERQAGRVVSNTVSVTVTHGAPPAVSRDGDDASVSIAREAGRRDWVATITNRRDGELLINTNFGVSPPFARAAWVYELADRRHELPVEQRVGASWHDFDLSKLVTLAAGESLELARSGEEELLRALADAGARVDGDRWTLHFEYDNLCDRNWQQRKGTALLGNDGAPAALRTLLPRNLLTRLQVSGRVPAREKE